MTPELDQISLNLLGQLSDVARVWYALPLMVAISLVYGATRHEQTREVLIHGVKSMLWISGFVAIIMLVVWAGGFWN